MWRSLKHEWKPNNARTEYRKCGYTIKVRYSTTDTYRLYGKDGKQVLRADRDDTWFQTLGQAKYIGDRLIDGYALDITDEQERRLRFNDWMARKK